MPSSSYGSYSPQAIDPFPIEATLAQLVGANNPAAASQALDLYQIKNDASQSIYNQQAGQQHEFAKEQLANQLYEKQLAAVSGATAHDGALELLQASNPEIFRNASPDVIQRVISNQTNLRNAKQAKDALEATYSGVQSGYTMDANNATRLAGVPLVRGTPLSTINAGISASGHDRGPTQPTIHVTPPPGPDGIQQSAALGGKTGINTPEQIAAFNQSRGWSQAPVQPPGGGGGKTNLPPAKSDPGTSGTASGGIEVLRNNTPGVKSQADTLRQNVEKRRAQLPPAWVQAYDAGVASNGGQPKLGRTKDGKMVILGADNKPLP